MLSAVIENPFIELTYFGVSKDLAGSYTKSRTAANSQVHPKNGMMSEAPVKCTPPICKGP